MNTAEDCTFCEIPNNRTSPFDLYQPIGDGSVYLTPTVGPLAAGHFLAVTREHFTSFARLGRERLEQVGLALAPYEARLGAVFGGCFRLEHGSDNICGSGACIEHAHTLLFSGVDDAGERMQELLPWETLDNYGDLVDFAGEPYVYLGRAGLHLAVADPKLPSQWGRIQVARTLGMDRGEADWAIRVRSAKLFETFSLLGRIPAGRLVWWPDSDKITLERKPSHPGHERDPLPPDDIIWPADGKTSFWRVVPGTPPEQARTLALAAARAVLG